MSTCRERERKILRQDRSRANRRDWDSVYYRSRDYFSRVETLSRGERLASDRKYCNKERDNGIESVTRLGYSSSLHRRKCLIVIVLPGTRPIWTNRKITYVRQIHRWKRRIHARPSRPTRSTPVRLGRVFLFFFFSVFLSLLGGQETRFQWLARCHRSLKIASSPTSF